MLQATVKELSQPLDQGFNVAVLHMARKVCPSGYGVSTEHAPQSYADLVASIAAEHRIIVDGSHSEHTIFADAEANFAFRAWHDWTHYIERAGFDAQVLARQIADLRAVYGDGHRTAKWVSLLTIEIMGQVRYCENHGGRFPIDQMAFTRAVLAGHPAWGAPYVY